MFLLKNVQTGCGIHPAPVCRIRDDLSPPVKRTRLEAHHPPLHLVPNASSLACTGTVVPLVLQKQKECYSEVIINLGIFLFRIMKAPLFFSSTPKIKICIEYIDACLHSRSPRTCTLKTNSRFVSCEL